MKPFRKLLPLVLLLTLPAVVQAQFTWTTNSGKITITGYTGPGGDVTVPDTITDLPVTSIANGVFYFKTSLTSVTLGNNVTSIRTQAFLLCSSLTNVTFGNSLTSIGQSAFAFCFSLTNVSIPASVTNIGI